MPARRTKLDTWGSIHILKSLPENIQFTNWTLSDAIHETELLSPLYFKETEAIKFFTCKEVLQMLSHNFYSTEPKFKWKPLAEP